MPICLQSFVEDLKRHTDGYLMLNARLRIAQTESRMPVSGKVLASADNFRQCSTYASDQRRRTRCSARTATIQCTTTMHWRRGRTYLCIEDTFLHTQTHVLFNAERPVSRRIKSCRNIQPGLALCCRGLMKGLVVGKTRAVRVPKHDAYSCL